MKEDCIPDNHRNPQHLLLSRSKNKERLQINRLLSLNFSHFQLYFTLVLFWHMEDAMQFNLCFDGRLTHMAHQHIKAEHTSSILFRWKTQLSETLGRFHDFLFATKRGLSHTASDGIFTWHVQEPNCSSKQMDFKTWLPSVKQLLN